MAILSKEINQVEVRIRRHPENTYFDEYVKVGDREKTDATACDRYIIPEVGQMYTIEVTLKRGYNFGNTNAVRASLHLPGGTRAISAKSIFPPKDYDDFTEEDLTIHLTYAKRVRVGGRSISGARFVFHKVSIDEELENETNVMDVDPKNLGSLRVEVMKEKYDLVPMTAAEQAKYIEGRRKETMTHDRSQTIWDAEKVDQENFKKHGITTAVGFVGGHYSQPSKNIYWRTNYSHGEPLIFQFCCRPAEFLEHVNIVRYPPPLHSFPWAQLDQDERRFALQKLQEIAKKRATNYGQIQIDPDDWPEEWDPWNIMQPYERHNAFKTLQEAEKAFQRDQVQNQIEEIHPSRIVDVENDNPGTVKDVTSRSSRRNVVDLCGSPPSTNRKRPAVSQLHRQSSPNVTQDNSGNRPTIARRPAIKQEPIDVDALSDTDVRMLSAPTIKYDASHASTRTAKRVKFEEVQEDDRVDLSRIEEFQQREPKTVEWEDRMAEKQSGDPKEVAEEEMGIVELDPVAEDSMSVEERHAAAQEKAKNDEEIEEASRQWAAMMKKAAQAEQSAM